MGRVIVVAGAGARVGKTRVASALARALTDQGARVVAIKAVDTGCRTDHPSTGEDGVILARATGQASPRHALCRLRSPGEAPTAAEQDRGRINFDALLEVIRAAARDTDFALLETPGGLLSPITWEKAGLDLALDLEAEVLLVAADRSGTVHDTRAAHRLLVAAGIPLAGLVVSRVEPPVGDGAFGPDLATLLRFEDLPPATGLPHLAALGAAAAALGPLARRVRRGPQRTPR